MAPSNDNFANALDLGSAVSGSDTSATHVEDATVESGEPCGSNIGAPYETVWYKWTAPGSGTATFDTHGSTTPDPGSFGGADGFLDTTMTVWTGTSLGALTEIVSDDDDPAGGTYTSLCTFNVVGGVVYLIQVGTYDSGYTGDIHLNWSVTIHTPTGGLIAVGSFPNWLLTSPDGEVWTYRTTPFDTGALYCVVWADHLKLWVVGGYNYAGTKSVMTSPDGEHWTMQSCPFDGNGDGVNTIAYSPTLKLLIASTSRNTTPNLIYSSDAVNWFGVDPVPWDHGVVTTLMWSPDFGRFFFSSNGWGNLGGGRRAYVLASSEDGTTWDTLTTPINGTIAPSIFFVGSSPGLLVAAGSFSYLIDGEIYQSIMTSPDGTNWTVRTVFPPLTLGANFFQPSWSPSLGLWVASTNDVHDDAIIVTSPDPSTTAWTVRDGPASVALAAGDSSIWSPSLGLFVVAGQSGYINQSGLRISNDGINWRNPSVDPSYGHNLYFNGIAEGVISSGLHIWARV